MTREEEIKEMARITASHITSDKDMQVAFADALRRGAEWADANPHWISVEDELPKDWEGEKQFVLYTEPYNEDYSYMGRLRIGEYDGDESKLYLIANNRWIIYGKNDGNTKVTHWMPLPQPPLVTDLNKKGLPPLSCQEGNILVEEEGGEE